MICIAAPSSPQPSPFPSPPRALAGDKSTPAPEPAPVQNSWFADNVLRPKTPFEVVPGKDPNGWSFRLEPYLWSPGVYGTVGIGNLPQMGVDSSPIDVLKQLDWGVFMQAEIAKAAGASRRTDSLPSSPPTSRRRARSTRAPARSSSRVLTRSSWPTARSTPELLRRCLRGSPRVLHGPRYHAEVNDNRATRIAQAIGQRVAPEKSFPTSADADRWWADPVLGLRFASMSPACCSSPGRPDVGGFGAGSDISFFTQGSAGVKHHRNISLEAGYRYMYVDYNKDNFLFRMNMPVSTPGWASPSRDSCRRRSCSAAPGSARPWVRESARWCWSSRIREGLAESLTSLRRYCPFRWSWSESFRPGHSGTGFPGAVCPVSAIGRGVVASR